MSGASDKPKPEKKSIHPVIWLILGVIIYAALQAWVFPKISLPG